MKRILPPHYRMILKEREIEREAGERETFNEESQERENMENNSIIQKAKEQRLERKRSSP